MRQRMNESQLYEQNTVCNRKSKKTGRFDLEGLRQPSILLVELDEIILTQRTLKHICTIKVSSFRVIRVGFDCQKGAN